MTRGCIECGQVFCGLIDYEEEISLPIPSQRCIRPIHDVDLCMVWDRVSLGVSKRVRPMNWVLTRDLAGDAVHIQMLRV